MAEGYSHGTPNPVDPGAEAERLAQTRKGADWQPHGIPAGHLGHGRLLRCARCGAAVYALDQPLHDAWHAAQAAPLAERVRSLATGTGIGRDRTRG